MDVSLVIPVYNERENLELLYGELVEVMEGTGRSFEILFVDDGSTDGSDASLEAIARRDGRVRFLQLRRNYGQSAAIQAGIDHASGAVIAILDGDLQNDPADIPRMLQKLDEGYDLVHGWRRHRQDAFWTRRVPSRIANWLIARVTGLPVHDLGCALKVMRRSIAEELELYGEMHRYVTLLAHGRGARCAELVVHHRPRRFGMSKYGLSRTLGVLLDVLTVKYLMDYFARPMRLMGKYGALCVTASILSLLAVIIMKIARGIDMTGNPLLLMSVLAAMLGGQFFSLGLIGEVCARIYYRKGGARNYAVRRGINIDGRPQRQAA